MWDRKTLIVLLLGLIFGISGAAYVNNKERTRRTPASTGLTTKIPWVRPPGGKQLALVKIELSAPSDIPESGSDDVTLMARIVVSQNLSSDLVYAWNLPSDVKITAGNQTDRLANVKQGQIVEVKLTVSGFNKEVQRLISLQASTQIGTSILGNSAIIASRPEDTWEAVAPAMQSDAEEQLGLPAAGKSPIRE